jgi:hypothetical protein
VGPLVGLLVGLLVGPLGALKAPELSPAPPWYGTEYILPFGSIRFAGLLPTYAYRL